MKAICNYALHGAKAHVTKTTQRKWKK